MNVEEEFPNGWRFATVDDVLSYPDEAEDAIDQDWIICKLFDGKIGGPGYGYDVEYGSFENLGEKLATNISSSSEWFGTLINVQIS